MAQRTYTETEENIFEAAVHEFACKGKNGARLHEIAKSAGVNKALVHYYFRNKELLYESVFDFMYSKFMRALHNAMEGNQSFRDLLKSFINGYIDFLKENEGYSLLLQQELGIGATTLRKKYDEVVGQFEEAPSVHFMKKMEEAQKNGEIRDVDPYQTFITLLGSCIYIFIAFPIISTARPELADKKDEYIESRKEHIYDLIYNGLKLKEN
ncbi:MAG TPA: TetR/AcrR family transcriptional regulator [Balneolales bacterium]|nr:TetR/AcrR family transcriptional regulator [Balneolales bacterium]